MENQEKPKFEMASADKPEEIIAASQRSIVSMIEDVVADLKKKTGAPGLTWEQIEHLLKLAKDKQPTVVFQNQAQ